MAALSAHDDLAREAIDVLVEHEESARCVLLAEDLVARGHPRYAGELLSRVDALSAAARAFAEANLPRRAAQAYELSGSPIEAAKVLEAALRAERGDDASRLALAQLLARHDRTEAAIRNLQQLRRGHTHRAEGLPLLGRLLSSLGYEEAVREVQAEMHDLGIDEVCDADSGPAAKVDAEPPAPNEHAARRVLFGRYEVVRDVASTAHARVVEAIDRLTTERVAVKIFAASLRGAGRDALRRFEREARALSEVQHPAVVSLGAYYPEGPAMVLEWMPGGDLAGLMRSEPIAPARAAEIAGAVLAAIGHAHRLGILHRDVKPANILFDAIGTPRLSDFGAAHLGDLSTTATAGAIGTFAYMSPEQRLGRPATVASDLYAVGALLHEMLTGSPAEPVESGGTSRALRDAHPELTEAHDALLARLLARDPAERPADAYEARTSLSALDWPIHFATRPESRRPRESTRPPPNGGDRLSPVVDVAESRHAGRLMHDEWLGRDILVLPLDEASLDAARAFARASHTSLPTVLRVLTAEKQIWIDRPLGRCLADLGRGPSPDELDRLQEAISALHAAGGAHGTLDDEHLYDGCGELCIAFPRELSDPAQPNEEVQRADVSALERLQSS